MTLAPIRQALARSTALLRVMRWARRMMNALALLAFADGIYAGAKWHWWALMSAWALCAALREYASVRVDHVHADIERMFQADPLTPRDGETFERYCARIMRKDGE